MRHAPLTATLALAALVLVACETPAPEPEIRAMEEMPTYEGRTIDEWVTVLRDPQAGSRMEASVALAALRPWSVEPLREALRDPDPGLRYAAALSVALIGPAAHAADPELVACLRDPEPRVRGVAARAVGGFGDAGTAGIVPLADLLRDEDRTVRFFAAEALAKLDGRSGEVLDLIEQAMLHDDDAEVRRMARAAYEGNADNRNVDRSGRPIQGSTGGGR